MVNELYYVKSFEDDFATKSLKGKKKITCQSVFDIYKSNTIKPNTLSFGKQKRLACTILHKKYTKTYRSQGIIFQTSNKPDYVLPFDLVLLGATDNIIVQYYRIKNNLHIYYNHQLIKGYNTFIFKNFNSMIKKIPSPSFAWIKVNTFRQQKGYQYLSKSKYRLVEYNEVVFHKKITIKPIALFGYTKKARIIAKKLKLPCYKSAKVFYEKHVKANK